MNYTTKRAVVEPGVFTAQGSEYFLGARLECGHIAVFRGLKHFDPKNPPMWFKFPKTTGCGDCQHGRTGKDARYYATWTPKRQADKDAAADRSKVANEISRSLNFRKVDPATIGAVVRAFLDAFDGHPSADGTVKVTSEYQLALATRADRWVPANGGHERTQTYANGRRLLYVFNFALGKHAYLDCDTDTILDKDEIFSLFNRS